MSVFDTPRSVGTNKEGWLIFTTTSLNLKLYPTLYNPFLFQRKFFDLNLIR